MLQKPVVARLPGSVGSLVTLPFAGSLPQQAADASPADPAWLAHLGVFPTAIALATFAAALRHLRASNPGVTTYLVPPITVLLGRAFLAETPPVAAYARRARLNPAEPG